jgi:LDH2 family malate/lactate/ureidoglycolate dehydrogenase
MSTKRVPYTNLKSFIESAMVALKLPQNHAATVAEYMASADLQGSDGHGVIRLPQYTRRILAGGVNTSPNITIESERAATALINGDNGMGHVVMKFATELAIKKAKSSGMAWVGSRLSNHAGPASLYSRMALDHDMVGLYFAVGNANHLPAWGGLDMLLSTNPISVAVPTHKETPIVLDMATTVAAYGKVKAKAQKGEMMPEGWMIDFNGQPLLDPKRSEEGFLLPIGGYKGYGLSLIVGILAGTLNNAAMGRAVIDFNHDDSSVTNTGQAIAIIDPAAFGDTQAFKDRVDQLIGELKASKKMPGVERIWLPGEQSALKCVDYTRNGIPISEGLETQLNKVSEQLNIARLF